VNYLLWIALNCVSYQCLALALLFIILFIYWWH
jgi:hypothetical protein